MIKRTILIVLDSLGVGAADDASRFGDEGANTLQHIAEYCLKNSKAFALPHMNKLGLGHLVNASNLPMISHPSGSFGILSELSPGKDTSTGHWEMAGNVLEKEFPVFAHGFDAKLLEQWCQRNQLPGFLANHAASGTEVLEQYGAEHLATGKPIIYTSADSVFQVAWSEEAFSLEKLYAICKDARSLLDPLGVGRIIARPFTGKTPGHFKRTENRRDYSLPPPQPNLLDVLIANRRFVAGVGKIEDIFCHRSLSEVNHTGRNETSLDATLDFMIKLRGKSGLIFTNLIDFDQLHGHRRNPATYADALMAFDNFLPKIIDAMDENDLLILTADHGNDPTFRGTDHTRENVPLLVYSKMPRFRPTTLGKNKGFNTIARLILESMGLPTEITKIEKLHHAPTLVEKMGLE